jgi:hypothetical protein
VDPGSELRFDSFLIIMDYLTPSVVSFRILWGNQIRDISGCGVYLVIADGSIVYLYLHLER